MEKKNKCKEKLLKKDQMQSQLTSKMYFIKPWTIKFEDFCKNELENMGKT